jgi:hypothetical protein
MLPALETGGFQIIDVDNAYLTSLPELRRVEPINSAIPISNLLHEVMRSARAIAALSVPQANKV